MKSWFGEITKTTQQADGSLIVEGIASTPVRDSDNEIITADAMRGAIEDYKKFPAVREQHDPLKACGTALDISVTEDGVTKFSAMIVDPIAVKKLLAGVYRGFSIGGRVLERDSQDKTIIKRIKLNEVSIVDVPANKMAEISLIKVDDVEEEDEEPRKITDDVHILPTPSVETATKSVKDPAMHEEKEVVKTETPEAQEVLEVKVEDAKPEAPVEKKGAKYSGEVVKALTEVHNFIKMCDKMMAGMGYMQEEKTEHAEDKPMEDKPMEEKTMEDKPMEEKTKSASDQDLKKSNNELKSQLAKAQEDFEFLKAETIKAIHDIKNGKGVLKSVTKENDGITDKAEVVEDLSTTGLIKQALRSGKRLY